MLEEKRLLDEFELLKETEPLFMQVINDDFTNVNDMGDNATLTTNMTELQHSLTLLTHARMWAALN